MRSKRLCLSGARDHQHEEKDGDEDSGGTDASIVAVHSSERCPICLNSLSLEVGFPEDCCHAFCISCILKWSETSTSCPVDRKPFQTVYKLDALGVCTKIHVATRQQAEHCSCNLFECFCTEEKICFRMDITNKSEYESMNVSTKDGCLNETTEELQNQSCASLIVAGDFMLADISDPVERNHINSREIEEDDLCLIRRKREGLKHLRLPTTMGRVESNSSLSVETLIHSPSFLDDYIFVTRPLSLRNKGFTKKTCVNSCPQEGVEKKQAASGSKGTRKKSVQSSTRRRSTRNSRSDSSQLPSSPKSSNSDNDTPGCNSSSTDNVSTEKLNKPPVKQRKRAAKKAPKTRKRLRSTTQTRQEADESKDDSESELEQDEKKAKIPEDSFDEKPCEMTVSSASSPEKAQHPAEDHSPIMSPMEQSTEDSIPASSPMQNMESFDNEIPASPKSLNEHKVVKDHSLSPTFTNGQTALEKSQPESTCESELDSDAVESAQCLNTKVECSGQAEDLQASEECLESPLSVKCTDIFHKESSSSDSDSESEVPEKRTIPSAEDTPNCMEKDYSSTGQAGVESLESLHESQSKSEHLQDMKDDTESSTHEDSTSLPALEPEKQTDLEHSPGSCDSFKQDKFETLELPKLSPVEHSSSKKDDRDEQDDEKEICLLEPKLMDTEKSVPSNPEQSSPDISVQETQLSKAEGLCDVELQDRLCNDDLQKAPLVSNEAESISKVASAVADGKISDIADLEEESDKNKEQVASSADNKESVAMECDSVCRESVQTTKLTETSVAEPCSSVSTKTGELKSVAPITEETPKKESRPRRSRFHSPSTTWSSSKNDVKEREKSRSRSRSKNRETSPKNRESPAKIRNTPPKNRDSSPKNRETTPKNRDSSPKNSETTPKNRDSSPKKNRESPPKNRDSPPKPPTSRSRSKDRDRNTSEQWKGRSKDRRHRRQSRSKSRSRSRSGSRTRNLNRAYTAERSEKDSPSFKERINTAERFENDSPSWRERRPNDNWKSPRGGDRFRRNEHERPNEHFRSDKFDPRDSSEPYPDNRNDQPDWVMERIKSIDSRGRGDGWMRGDGRGRGWGDVRGRGRGENRGRGDYRGRGDFRGRGDHRGRGDGRGRGGNRGRGSPRGSHWDDNQYNSGDSWNRNVNVDWNSPRGRGGRGRGGFRGGFNYSDQNENSWNNRLPYSGNSNTSGHESTRMPDHTNYNPKYEETYESPVDRSGWTSASSWAVRKTLPADVQNYYSKRGKNTTGSQQGWTRPDVPQEQDQALKDQPSQQTESAPMPVNIVQPQINVVQQPIVAPPPPQPVNMYPYSVGVHPPLVSMQHNPYNIHPPIPMHLHPALPLVPVSAPSSVPQGLPPPPPPPPPSQQVGYVAPIQEAKPLQAIPSVSHVSNTSVVPPLTTPPAVQGGMVGTAVAQSSASVAASSYSKNPYGSVKSAPWKETITVEASADSSRKEKFSVPSGVGMSQQYKNPPVSHSAPQERDFTKIIIQERAAQEVKGAIKPYYQNKDITKDEYKEIVKKAVDKVCHSKSGEVDSAKVANLVKAYVDKYKHSRKKGADDKF